MGTRPGWIAALLLAAAPAANAGATGTDLSDAVADVAARAVPAVVHIQVERGGEVAPALRELASEVPGLLPPDGGAPRRVSGSGVIVSEGGKVYTNHHVVDGARRVTVVLSDQRHLPATVVGSDPRTDIAVLQIDAAGPFPSLPVGDSDALRVGELVVAVGSPFDFTNTVTLGVVSAKGRRGLAAREIHDFVQTDAAVNPGNSGGPLVDLHGHVVALKTAIYSPGVDQNSGVSFAIPSALLLRVGADIEALGRVRRPWLGFVAETVEEVEGDASLHGVEVSYVIAESPAARSGLRRGDAIVSVNGEPMSSASDLRSYVLSRAIGEPLSVDVVRDGTPVVLALVPVEQRSERLDLDVLPEGVFGWAGTWLVDPDEDVLSRFGVPIEGGVVVVDVDPESPAARFGVLAGDAIVAVDGARVDSVDALRAQLALRVGGHAVVMIHRDDGEVVGVLPRP